jgi:CheY-like chemotaxis protein/nitrogen-specific signal transduction histidine kinase
MQDYISTVLLVDDDKFGLDTLEMVLYGEGYHLIMAKNGPEALAQIKTHRPDLVLLDVMMPGMSGFEVCEQVRATSELNDIPIIMLTALDARDSKIEGIAAGADDFITKPYDHLELRTRVRTITKLNRFRRLMLERNKFEWVVENADDGYLILDLEGNIQYVNRRASVLLGVDLESLQPLRGSFMDIAQKNYHCQPEPAWKNWLTDEATNKERFLVCPESSNTLATWIRVDKLDSENVYGNEFLIRLTDVTNEVLEQRLLWAFYSQINHKLRTPLGLFMGYMDILEYKMPAFEPESQTLIDNIYDAGKRLENHLVDIFAYVDSVGDSRRGSPFQLVDCQPLIEQIVAELSLQDVAFSLPFADSSLSLILTRQSMEVIFTELLTNAQKFHPNKTPQIQIEGEVVDSKVVFTVTDDGQNLPASELANIWLPYYQVEKFFSGQEPGTGLGLAKVAGLIWETGGRYQALSREDGVGVCLKLYLPLATPENYWRGWMVQEGFTANKVE